VTPPPKDNREGYCPGCEDWVAMPRLTDCPACGEWVCEDHAVAADHGCVEVEG